MGINGKSHLDDRTAGPEPAAVSVEGRATVTPLWTDVVLDDNAIGATRRALLAELTVEQFRNAAREGGRGDEIERIAARHLARGAYLARQAADRERARCAAGHRASGTRVEMS